MSYLTSSGRIAGSATRSSMTIGSPEVVHVLTKSIPQKNQTASTRRNEMAEKGIAVTAAGLAGLYVWARTKTPEPVDDILFLFKLIRIKKYLERICTQKEYSLVDDFENTVEKFPKKEAIYFVDTGASYSYKQFNEKCNQVAHWALQIGLKKGDTVALLMDNRPEFLFTWIGLCKIGVVIALINTNISGAPLIHSLKVSYANNFIVGIEHAQKLLDSKSSFPSVKWFVHGGDIPDVTRIDLTLENFPTNNPPKSLRAGINAYDKCLYIYTSGTTGNPKAGVITHRKFCAIAVMFRDIYGVSSKDRFYCVLPLYHSAGGAMALGMCLFSGATLVLRKKFSASNFWVDIRVHKCTITQYIGELCRYLLGVPPTPDDGKSGLRLAVGNGLRPDIWEQFQKRFNVPLIGEFYGATEGNGGLVNVKGKVGAVGYVSPLYPCLLPLHIVKFDVITEQPLRDENGFCIKCKDGEIGELIVHIDAKDKTNRFDGYTDNEASEKKILRNVFEKGDAYFRSGDLLKQEHGYYYFMDRIGDTFRWKGENVSTNEVAQVLTASPGVKEANVYGVAIPGHDGRAGMATLTTDSSFDISAFYALISKDLPKYARPLFIRLRTEMEITSTFKHLKQQLMKEGFDPSLPDKIYFRDDTLGKFVKVDQQLYESIMSRKLESKL